MSVMLSLLFVKPAEAVPSRGALWQQFEEHFDASGVPRADAGHGAGCLTGVVAQLRENLEILEDWQQEAVLLAIEPWRRHAEPGMPPPESCFGRIGENYVEGPHFTVEWNGNTISQSQAEDYLEALEYSWQVEVDELGWYAPSGASQTPILAFVESGNYAGAYTTVNGCSQGGVSGMPYIVTYAGSFYGGSWYKTMAAHEFLHATQFYYGYGHEFYWWEASATWIEEYVYPALNDWADPIYYGYSQQPHIAFNASDQNDESVFWHMYAMAIWAFYLDEKVGGHDMVQQIWELGWRHQNTYYDLWMPDLINEAGHDFSALFPEFMATVAVADFSDPVYFFQPVMHDEVDTLPASGGAGNEAPQSLGQNFIRFDAELGADSHVLELTFDGEDGVDWFAVLVRGQENVLSEYVSIELEDGSGTGQISFPEGDDDIYLVVSPMDPAAVGIHYNWSRAAEFDYEWSAELVEVVEVDDGDGNGGNGGNGDDEGVMACGCSASGSALSLSWIVGLLALVRRR